MDWKCLFYVIPLLVKGEFSDMSARLILNIVSLLLEINCDLLKQNAVGNFHGDAFI